MIRKLSAHSDRQMFPISGKVVKTNNNYTLIRNNHGLFRFRPQQLVYPAHVSEFLTFVISYNPYSFALLISTIENIPAQYKIMNTKHF